MQPPVFSKREDGPTQAARPMARPPMAYEYQSIYKRGRGHRRVHARLLAGYGSIAPAEHRWVPDIDLKGPMVRRSNIRTDCTQLHDRPREARDNGYGFKGFGGAKKQQQNRLHATAGLMGPDGQEISLYIGPVVRRSSSGTDCMQLLDRQGASTSEHRYPPACLPISHVYRREGNSSFCRTVAWLVHSGCWVAGKICKLAANEARWLFESTVYCSEHHRDLANLYPPDSHAYLVSVKSYLPVLAGYTGSPARYRPDSHRSPLSCSVV